MSLLDGWGEIAQRLSQRAGVSISVPQAKRYQQREGDPLPVRRIGRNRRRRVVARAPDIDAWAAREFR